jgi:hypothetical protein
MRFGQLDRLIVPSLREKIPSGSCAGLRFVVLGLLVFEITASTGIRPALAIDHFQEKACSNFVIPVFQEARAHLVTTKTEYAFVDKMATTNIFGQVASQGRDVLVAGAGSIADGKSAAVISIDLGTDPVSPQANLELLLAPVTVSPNENYLIVVSIRSSNASGAKRLGTVSFFPPRPGVTQAFYFKISPILEEIKARGTGRLDLSIALASRHQSLLESAVRIVGARIVDG